MNSDNDVTVFEWPVRVYYEDTDSGGVVYHARYLHFLERARTEWFRAYGFSQIELAQQFKRMFVVSSMQLDFIKPAKLDDNLIVSSVVRDISRIKMVFEQSVLRERDQCVLFSGRSVVVSVNNETFLPGRMPKEVLDKIL